jgi:hypothetical protein
LFFRLSGPDGLFLAGDPAQSVVEGVEFRFEDVRSVGHFLFEHDRKLIPDKPKIVNVNFRSHSGVLGVAAGILGHLFEAFPDSAKQLSKDRGLFTGPRPSVLQKIEMASVKELVARLDGVVIITHDEHVSYLKQRLDYPLVYGIREAKGLEFEMVIVLDFFRWLPASIQKPFRDLMVGRNVDDVGVCCPEIEGYLKLLYTGVTRCIQRLYFAETVKSTCGDAFVRWITSSTSDGNALAVRQRVSDVEAMSHTPDEWKAMGLENAVNAEASVDLSESIPELARQGYLLFRQGRPGRYVTKGRAHQQSVSLRMTIADFDRGKGNLIELELEVARVSENLVLVGLTMEARRLLSALRPLLNEYSQTKLQEAVLAKLPSLTDDSSE